ncbi:MAG TPA: YbaK/EbsC family protein [Pirellulales bacterium]|nr:YbaK/EbsC family protein [Pirellulales bacterium]
MTAQNWIRQILHKRRIPFQEVHHAEGFTSQDVARQTHMSGRRVAKVVIAMADGLPVELVLPATRHVVMDRLRKVLNAHDVRFATEHEIERCFADVEPGSIPPLPHRQWHEVPVIMDEAMKVDGELLIQAGTHTDAVRLQFDDWFKLVKPRVEQFSAEGDVTRISSARRAPPNEANSLPQETWLLQFLTDLLAVLHLQAKEIERLSAHVEQHTDRLLEESKMPLVVSELSALHADVKDRQ